MDEHIGGVKMKATDPYAYNIMESLADSDMATDDELTLIKAYLEQ